MTTQTGIQKALALFDGSPTKLAVAIGNGVLRQHIEHWLKAGNVPAEKCPEVFAATGVALEELNDKTNWALVRGDVEKQLSPVIVSTGDALVVSKRNNPTPG